MFKTLTLAAIALATLSGIAATEPASAKPFGCGSNCTFGSQNGTSLNGMRLNGMRMNGQKMQGRSVQGTQLSGAGTVTLTSVTLADGRSAAAR